MGPLCTWVAMHAHAYRVLLPAAHRCIISPFSQVDDVEHPSWQAQIKGEKLWILDPPRECHYACKRLEVIVHPGEISKTTSVTFFDRALRFAFNSRAIFFSTNSCPRHEPLVPSDGNRVRRDEHHHRCGVRLKRRDDLLETY